MVWSMFSWPVLQWSSSLDRTSAPARWFWVCGTRSHGCRQQGSWWEATFQCHIVAQRVRCIHCKLPGLTYNGWNSPHVNNFQYYSVVIFDSTKILSISRHYFKLGFLNILHRILKMERILKFIKEYKIKICVICNGMVILWGLY